MEVSYFEVCTCPLLWMTLILNRLKYREGAGGLKKYIWENFQIILAMVFGSIWQSIYTDVIIPEMGFELRLREADLALGTRRLTDFFRNFLWSFLAWPSYSMGKAHKSGKESELVALTCRLPARRELKARARSPVNRAGMEAETNLSFSCSFWLFSCSVLRW